MRMNVWMLAASAALFLPSQPSLIAQDSGTVPVHLVVTAESTKDNAAAPAITEKDMTVKQGKNNRMPPWGDVLNDDDIGNLWAYVSSRRSQ